jgi:hypothetical protein
MAASSWRKKAAWFGGMHSSETAARMTTLAGRIVVGASLFAIACSPVPATGQSAGAAAPPECATTGVGSTQDADTLAALRRSVETGPFYAIGSRSGVALCRVTRDDDAIRLEYTFRDGASLRITRNPKIEYTDQEVRLVSPLAESAVTVLTRAEQAAFDTKGCGIDWRQAETGPAADDPRATESIYRGEVCNCQARARSDASGRVVRLQLRSAC